MKCKSLEMKFLLYCVTLNLLILANFVSSQTIVDATDYSNTEQEKDNKVKYFDIKLPFSIACNTSGDDGTVVWKKEEEEVSSGRVSFKTSGKTHTLHIEKSLATDAGNYTCALMSGGSEKESVEIEVSAKPAVKLSANTNVVEQEKLIIPCTVLGNPTPIVTWRVGNKTLNASDERVSFDVDPDTNVPNTILVIKDVQLDDRAVYTCHAKSVYSEKVFSEASSQVRVKDKLAALWPFLGICAEVFILCAIILIYEKKRNKTELEESDTDQSPDQKNTPDHGKDSDVRHRK